MSGGGPSAVFGETLELADPSDADARLRAFAVLARLSAMTEDDRMTSVEHFYGRYFASPQPVPAHLRVMNEYLRPLLAELVRSRRHAFAQHPHLSARVVDELYYAGTEEALRTMLISARGDPVLLYAIRKFPVDGQPAAVRILREEGAPAPGLRALGHRFYHPDVVAWMLEGFTRDAAADPSRYACTGEIPPTISASPLIRDMDTVYQLHREGFFDRAALGAWWRRLLRAVRPVADRLSPADRFIADEGDPAGLVQSVRALLY